MGREQRRKEEKRKKINNVVNDDEEMYAGVKFSTLIKIVVGISLILLVLYYFVAVFITKELNVSGNNTNSSENSNTTAEGKILAASVFNQVEEKYYVYFYDFKNEDTNISSLVAAKSDWAIYRVDTSNGLNSKYVTDGKGNSSVTGLDNLKVMNPTLIEITNDKVTNYLEGSSAISNFLSE